MQEKQDKQETHTTQAKSTKERLDELRGLHNNGYVTESEFKAARVNILKDGGFDVATRQQQQQPVIRPSYRERERDREEEETQQGGGCGCFIMTLLLIFLVFGTIFIAAPHWPSNLGGSAVMAAREWVIRQTVAGINHFRGQPAPAPILDHAPALTPTLHEEERQPEHQEEAPVLPPALPYSETEQPDSAELNEPVEPVEESADVIEPVEAVSPEVEQIPPQPAFPPVTTLPTVPTGAGSIALPPIDENLLQTDPGAAGPEIITIETPQADTSIRGYVTSANARIRSTPDMTANNVVGWASRGDRFTVLEEARDSVGARWLYVVYDTGNRRGWTSASIVRLEN